MLFALGLGDEVVAVTHECDHPPTARSLPQLTRTVVPDGLSASQIDAEVKRVVGEGRALYELDEERLAAVAPDLIVTQAVDDVGRLGRAAGVPRAAAELRAELEGRLMAVEGAVAEAPRTRTLALEWLDPPFIAGHWVPEMIEAAGGLDVVGRPGQKSFETGWEGLQGLDPEIVVAMPCGFYVEQALNQAADHRVRVESLGARQIFAVDAASSFSRPGPRLVDGVELLAHLLHPDRVDAPGNVGFAELAARAPHAA